MNILATLDRNYLEPFMVLLCSLLMNHPEDRFCVYLISSDVTQDELAGAYRMCARFGSELHLIAIDEDSFEQAPTLRYYSKAMYYRLLAAQLLPDHLDRILYLDPDILVIGSLRELYDMDMGENLYAAAMHEGLINLSGPVNQLRLQSETRQYYNSGVLLMNLSQIRTRVKEEEIFAYVEGNKNLLILPDQDVLNGLYGKWIAPLDECRYNYDARKYSDYLLMTHGELDTRRVMENTAILHFCGKQKPWKEGYRGRFASLYMHYMQLAARYRA